jgi:hypothetical protein
MNFSSFTLIITTIVSITIVVLGYEAYSARKASTANRAFFIFTIFFSAWLFSNFSENYFLNINHAKTFLSLDFALAPFFVFFFSFFIFNFPQAEKRLSST